MRAAPRDRRRAGGPALETPPRPYAAARAGRARQAVPRYGVPSSLLITGRSERFGSEGIKGDQEDHSQGDHESREESREKPLGLALRSLRDFDHGKIRTI